MSSFSYSHLTSQRVALATPSLTKGSSPDSSLSSLHPAPAAQTEEEFEEFGDFG